MWVSQIVVVASAQTASNEQTRNSRVTHKRMGCTNGVWSDGGRHEKINDEETSDGAPRHDFIAYSASSIRSIFSSRGSSAWERLLVMETAAVENCVFRGLLSLVVVVGGGWFSTCCWAQHSKWWSHEAVIVAFPWVVLLLGILEARSRVD